MTSPTFTGRITHPWTRIADRWPEEGVPVLVLTKHGMTVAKWETLSYGRRYWNPVAVEGQYCEMASLQAEQGPGGGEPVSHWMVLPEMP